MDDTSISVPSTEFFRGAVPVDMPALWRPHMNAPERLPNTPAFLAETHEVINVSRELVDFNLYEQDAALREAVQREGAAWAHEAR